MIQDPSNRIANSTHDVLKRAPRLSRIGAFLTFVKGCFADAADWSKGAIKNADNLTEGDVLRLFDQPIPSLDPSAAGENACPFECQEDLLEKLDRNVLTCSNILPLDVSGSVRGSQFQ